MICRRWCFLLLALVLMVGSITAQELAFVTINVWSGLDYKGIFKMEEYEARPVRKARYRLLVDELKTLDPDVIAVNEANPLPGYARRLARDLDYDYIYNVGMSGIKIGCLGIPVNFKEGDAILARKDLDLRKVGAPRLSPGGGPIGNCASFHFAESNQAIAGRITMEGQAIYVVNTHLHAGLPDEERWLTEIGYIRDAGLISNEEHNVLVDTWQQSVARRQNETQALLAWMRARLPADAPVVLMGDFNAEPNSEEIAWMLTENFVDTWVQVHGPEKPGYTWEPTTNTNIQAYYHVPEPYDPVPWYEKLKAENSQVSRRIDYIFVKNIPAEYILNSELVFNRAPEGQHPSDHFGVLTTLRFGARQME